MAIVTMEDILKALTDKFGETPDDDAISIMENVTDTFKNIKESSSENWLQEKARLEQAVIDKDREWRKKYTERFVTGHSSADEEDAHEEDDNSTGRETEITFDDLFTDKK